jgi:predicted glycoside hydrolase/deacetylase ChbG (UPF0249 family)
MGCGCTPPARYRLIVNADDFGFTRDVNEGIVEAHRNGILTATTLMGNGAAFEYAVELAKATPSLDVGCHLVLVQGESQVERSSGKSGRALPATITELMVALALRKIDPYEELAAQVRRITGAGLRPTHLDTHKHTHLLPAVLKAVARIAHEFRIPWVRRPYDFVVDPTAPLWASAIAVGMRATGAAMARELAAPLRSTDHFAGFQITGTLDKATLAATLERLPEGLTELMCHPGRLGDELRAAKTRLKESREVELAALTSPEVRAVIERRGIALTNYR